MRQAFKDSAYVAVLDTAVLRIEDGLASVSLKGRGHRRGETNPDLEVALSLQGYLSAERVSPESGTLQFSVTITDVRAQAGPAMVKEWLTPASRYFAGLKAEDWNRNPSRLEIPVRVDQVIQMPTVHSEVKIPSSQVPLAVRSSALTVFERRVAVSLEFAELREGPDTTGKGAAFGAESPWAHGMAAGARAVRHIQRTNRDSLLAERERLSLRVRALSDRDTLWSALRGSDRDVSAVVPGDYLQRLTRHFVRSYLQRTDLDIGDGEIEAKLNEQIKVRVLGKKVGAGRVKGSLRVMQLRGRLRPAGDITLSLEPPNRLFCRVPVEAVRARGRLDFDLEWDPAFLTAVVCRSFQYRDTLIGNALPFRSALRGTRHLPLGDPTPVGQDA